MRPYLALTLLGIAIPAAAWLQACGEGNANEQLIGAQCAAAEDCDDGDEDTPALECVTDFKGGYCGRKGCTLDADCPEGALCATLEQANYCFLTCVDKVDCNQNRELENESNCSSSVDPVSGGEAKLCVPPSAGE